MVDTCCLFGRPHVAPDISGFARGALANGYAIEFRTPDEFDGRENFDLVAVGGGRGQYHGKNGEIVEHYVSRGIPSIICEFGRLVPGTLLLLLNGKPWLPPTVQPADRLERLGLCYEPESRGDDILVCGQRPSLDRQLEDAITAIHENSGRKVIFRPHPDAWRIKSEAGYVLPGIDEISNRCTKLGEATFEDLWWDLDRAWCVVTHSSIVAVTAALRGIPVIASDECAAAEICTPLEMADGVDTIRPPADEDLHDFLCRFSYSIWFDEEIEEGMALRFMREFF